MFSLGNDMNVNYIQGPQKEFRGPMLGCPSGRNLASCVSTLGRMPKPELCVSMMLPNIWTWRLLHQGAIKLLGRSGPERSRDLLRSSGHMIRRRGVNGIVCRVLSKGLLGCMQGVLTSHTPSRTEYLPKSCRGILEVYDIITTTLFGGWVQNIGNT